MNLDKLVSNDDEMLDAGQWRMWFDDLCTRVAGGTRIVIKSPNGHKYWYALKLTFDC